MKISWPSFGRKTKKVMFSPELKGKGMKAGLDVPVAVMIPMVSMMYADERQHPSERLCVHAICAESPIFQKPSTRDIDTWMLEARNYIGDQGGDERACKDTKGVLSQSLRETSFAFAIRVLFADEKVKPAEQDRAERLAHWLEINEARASAIVEVVSILRHGRDAR